LCRDFWHGKKGGALINEEGMKPIGADDVFAHDVETGASQLLLGRTDFFQSGRRFAVFGIREGQVGKILPYRWGSSLVSRTRVDYRRCNRVDIPFVPYVMGDGESENTMNLYFSGIGGTAVRALASLPLIYAVYLSGSRLT
jgi:hypothetical protein